MTTETLEKANTINKTINALMFATEHMTSKEDIERTTDLMAKYEAKLKQL